MDRSDGKDIVADHWKNKTNASRLTFTVLASNRTYRHYLDQQVVLQSDQEQRRHRSKPICLHSKQFPGHIKSQSRQQQTEQRKENPALREGGEKEAFQTAPRAPMRHNSYTTTLPTSPRDVAAQADRSVHEPAHPFHHATISASSHSSSPAGHGSRLSPSGRATDAPNPSTFQDYDRSSTVSSVSTPYSQSNSASQIFEETSFFNQLSSNDSLSRGQIQQQLRADQLNREGEYQSSSLFGQNQGRYGLGFSGNNPTSSLNYHQSEHDNRDDDDDDTDGDHTDRDDDGSSQDESGPLREQIKQLQLEDVLAFLPVGGTSASGMLQRPADDGYQRRTASGDKMPFQLDDELANLGTKSLEEILGHDGGDEDDGDRVKGIRFKDSMAPSRMRGLGREGDSPTKIRISPERSGPNSQKSSAHNSVGSSFSDLSDSSVTQSAMEDAYLSGYNNSKM
ncbi:hypothetical protein BGZ89_011184 [Linnemannia elongata]|nr:hypothetical protein BGZ89_011184 [Linnemannia elongata]